MPLWLSCAGGSSSLPTALQMGIASVCWAAGDLGGTGHGLWIKAYVLQEHW